MAAIALFAVGVAAPSAARFVTTDDGWQTFIGTGCYLDTSQFPSPCSAKSLPLKINIGGTLYNSISLYDDGLVSLGAEAQLPPDPYSSDPSAFGPNVALVRFQLVDPTPDANFGSGWFSEVVSSSPGAWTAHWFYGNVINFNRIDIIYYDENDEPVYGPVPDHFEIGKSEFASLTITSLGTGRARFDFTWDDYGYYGYNFGDLNRPVDYLAPGSDSFEIGQAVPEPATWALLITGFGLTGAALRRRRVAAA